jgi:hypothetical protein
MGVRSSGVGLSCHGFVNDAHQSRQWYYVVSWWDRQEKPQMQNANSRVSHPKNALALPYAAPSTKRKESGLKPFSSLLNESQSGIYYARPGRAPQEKSQVFFLRACDK